MSRTKLLPITESEQSRLDEGFSLKDLTASAGWAVFLDKYLLRTGESIWVDPISVKDTEEFRVKYTAVWAVRDFARELVQEITNAIADAEAIDQKRRGKEEEDGFDIGS